MKVKEFKNEISKGLGSVILYLRNNPGKSSKYFSTIGWACCHDTRLDHQCDQERSQYLYEIMCLSERKEELENMVLDRLLQNKKYGDAEQLFGIAEKLYKNGNTKARDIIYKKFDCSLTNLLQKKARKPFDCDLDFVDAGAISIINIDRLTGLEYVTDAVGNAMSPNVLGDIFNVDWFISYSQDEIGEKEVSEFLRRKAITNKNIQIFMDVYYTEKLSRQEYQRNLKVDLPTFDKIISVVNEHCDDLGVFLTRRNVLRRLGQKASKDVLVKVAYELENETDHTRQIALLYVFLRAAYPLSIDTLIEIVKNEKNEELVDGALSALRNITDNRVHELALDLLHDEKLYFNALELLVLNFENEFDAILNILKKYKDSSDFHGLTMIVRDVFEANKTPECLDILLYLYHNTPCTSCRTSIVELMDEINIIPESIIQECQYDCVNEIRELVTRKINRVL